MKFDSATRFCKICFLPIEEYALSDLWVKKRFVCSRCLAKMNPRIEHYKIKGVSFMSVYDYNEEIRNLLFLFKACGDIELAPVFLSEQSLLLHGIFHHYYLVNAPSYYMRDEKRGFSHVKEIFRVLNLPFLDCLEKIEDVKQADLNYAKRQQIGKYLTINSSAKIVGKKILFVDDVVTSGATAIAATKLLYQRGAKKVKVLSMAHTHLS